MQIRSINVALSDQEIELLLELLDMASVANQDLPHYCSNIVSLSEYLRNVN